MLFISPSSVGPYYGIKSDSFKNIPLSLATCIIHLFTKLNEGAKVPSKSKATIIFLKSPLFPQQIDNDSHLFYKLSF